MATKTAKMTFGTFFKDCRIKLGLTLRDFCVKNRFDPGNISKLERGLLGAPQSRGKLEEYAKALHLKKGDEPWHDLFDLAYAEQGRIPDELMADKDLVSKLPLFFRTMRGKKVSGKQLDRLVEKLRES
jgi:transcriptional regulator with XRE-family HTH domain